MYVPDRPEGQLVFAQLEEGDKFIIPPLSKQDEAYYSFENEMYLVGDNEGLRFIFIKVDSIVRDKVAQKMYVFDQYAIQMRSGQLIKMPYSMPVIRVE